MKNTPWFNSIHPWRNGLLATTGLSLFAVIASLLWVAGHAQWAFLLAFLAIWFLISLSWCNDRFIEQSGSILARIVDHNFRQVHERMESLEQELEMIQGQRVNPAQNLLEG